MQCNSFHRALTNSSGSRSESFTAWARAKALFWVQCFNVALTGQLHNQKLKSRLLQCWQCDAGEDLQSLRCLCLQKRKIWISNRLKHNVLPELQQVSLTQPIQQIRRRTILLRATTFALEASTSPLGICYTAFQIASLAFSDKFSPILAYFVALNDSYSWHHSADDRALQEWSTMQEPIIRWPPTELGRLTGFRDPFIIQRKSETSPWKLIVGSGIEHDKERQGQSHGTILLYQSDSLTEGDALPMNPPYCLQGGRSLCRQAFFSHTVALTGLWRQAWLMLQWHRDWWCHIETAHLILERAKAQKQSFKGSAGWEFQGTLEDGLSRSPKDGSCCDLGDMWECPFFVQLLQHGSDSGHPSDTWMLCVSPYPHKLPEIIQNRPTNPVLYWLGQYADDKFPMSSASSKIFPLFLPQPGVLYQAVFWTRTPNRDPIFSAVGVDGQISADVNFSCSRIEENNHFRSSIMVCIWYSGFNFCKLCDAMSGTSSQSRSMQGLSPWIWVTLHTRPQLPGTQRAGASCSSGCKSLDLVPDLITQAACPCLESSRFKVEESVLFRKQCPSLSHACWSNYKAATYKSDFGFGSN